MTSRYGSPPVPYDGQLSPYPISDEVVSYIRETDGADYPSDVQPVVGESVYHPYATSQQIWQGRYFENDIVDYPCSGTFSPNAGNKVDIGAMHWDYQHPLPTNKSYPALDFVLPNVKRTPLTLGSEHHDLSASTPTILEGVDCCKWTWVSDVGIDLIKGDPLNDELTAEYVSSLSFNQVVDEGEGANEANSLAVLQEYICNREQSQNSIVPGQGLNQESADQQPLERVVDGVNLSQDEFNQPDISLSLPTLLVGEQQHQSLRSMLPPHSYGTPLTSTLCPSTTITLTCDEPGCNIEFTGRYGKGNRTRHKRHKHRDEHGILTYSCIVESCYALVFQRSDALLRHYKKEHPELKIPSVRRRKSENQSTRPTSSYMSVAAGRVMINVGEVPGFAAVESIASVERRPLTDFEAYLPSTSSSV